METEFGMVFDETLEATELFERAESAEFTPELPLTERPDMGEAGTKALEPIVPHSIDEERARWGFSEGEETHREEGYSFVGNEILRPDGTSWTAEFAQFGEEHVAIHQQMLEQWRDGGSRFFSLEPHRETTEDGVRYSMVTYYLSEDRMHVGYVITERFIPNREHSDAELSEAEREGGHGHGFEWADYGRRESEPASDTIEYTASATEMANQAIEEHETARESLGSEEIHVESQRLSDAAPADSLIEPQWLRSFLEEQRPFENESASRDTQKDYSLKPTDSEARLSAVREHNPDRIQEASEIPDVIVSARQPERAHPPINIDTRADERTEQLRDRVDDAPGRTHAHPEVHPPRTEHTAKVRAPEREIAAPQMPSRERTVRPDSRPAQERAYETAADKFVRKQERAAFPIASDMIAQERPHAVVVPFPEITRTDRPQRESHERAAATDATERIARALGLKTWERLSETLAQAAPASTSVIDAYDEREQTSSRSSNGITLRIAA